MKVHTSLVFRGLVSPLTSSVWATILSGAAKLARASECDGDTTSAAVEPTAANITAALRKALPNFMMFKFATKTIQSRRRKQTSDEHTEKKQLQL
jgi:hypothetical protein